MPVIHVPEVAESSHADRDRMVVRSLTDVNASHIRLFGALNDPDYVVPEALRQGSPVKAPARGAGPNVAALVARAFARASAPSPNGRTSNTRSAGSVPEHLHNVPSRDPVRNVAREIGLGF